MLLLFPPILLPVCPPPGGAFEYHLYTQDMDGLVVEAKQQVYTSP